jgi:[acyl-carrier-protein] S-malonyltransferase
MKAFVFTGQGNEYSEMAKELYKNNEFAKNFIDKLNINFDFKDIFVKESNLIHDTRYSQIGNFVISTILTKLLNDKGIYADVCAGLSLGEYTALCYSNAISIDDTVSILENRSNIMYEALNGKNTGMYAVMFLNSKEIEKIVREFDNVWVANYNSPDQIVISGNNDELEKCSKKCLEMGAKKVVKLDVIGAFHSELLKEASNKLKEVLNNYNFNTPSIPIYYNYVGNKSNRNIKELLVKQLYSSVKFEQSIINMINDGVDEFYVIGVGKSIDSFIRSIAINNKLKLKVTHIEKLQDLEAINNE